MTYRRGFEKYAGRTPLHYLETIFTKAPGLIGQWLKYTMLDLNAATSTLKIALKKLCDAGLILLIHTTSAAGLPLVSHINEKKTKFFFS